MAQNKSVLVILDSNHEKQHVAKELKLYSQLVTKGSYLIVEDTDLNTPWASDDGWGDRPGPNDALQEFLDGNKDFVVDRDKEKFFITVCKGGFLKRV